MVREFDKQLLESAAVRRNRLRESLLWGRDRRSQAVPDNGRRLLAGLVVAALACTACVGWSLLQQVATQRSTSSTSVTVPR